MRSGGRELLTGEVAHAPRRRSCPSSPSAVASTLASMTIDVASRSARIKRAAAIRGRSITHGAPAGTGAGPHRASAAAPSVCDQPAEEVLLHRLAGHCGTLAQDGVNIVRGTILDLHAGHHAILAPVWRHHKY